MVKISEMVPVEEEEVVVFDADKKRMFNAFASDDAYAMRFRQDVKEGAKAEDYFGYVKSEKSKNYVSAAFRGVANTVIGAAPNTVRRISRMGTDYVVSHLNEKDEDYIKRTEKLLADLDAKTPEEQAKFYNNDVLFNSREELEAEIRHVKTRLADRKSKAFDEEVKGVYDRIKKKNDAWIESFGFAKRPEDSEFMYGLGAASTSLLMSLGLSVVTKSAAASSVLFGFSQAGNVYEEVREKGAEPGTALRIASVAGTAEAALEAWGLHKLVENMRAKTWIKSAAKGFLSESVQEMSQQGFEEFLLRDYRQDEQAEEKIKRVLYSGIYGGILGSASAIGGRPFVKRHARETETKLLECGVNKEDAAKMVEDAAFGSAKEREKAVLDIQRAIEVSELVKEGFSEQDAEQIAKSIAVTDDEMKSLLSQAAEAEADPQAYEGGSIETGVQYMDKRLAEINPFDEDFDIKERVKTAALENGVSEEQAELAGTLTENFSRVIANVTNESPAEQWENGAELIIEGVRPPKMEEMTEVNEGDSDTDYWDKRADEEATGGSGGIADTFDYTGGGIKGTYMGADGRIHMEDGTVLFQSALSKKTAFKAKEVKSALKKIADGSSEETVENLRDDLEQYGGTNDVTFVFGDDKKGLRHIAQKHGVKTLLKVFDAVVDGKIARFAAEKKTVHLSKNGIEAVLSLDEHGKKKTWLLTGYDTKISSDEEREFRTTLNPTQPEPTFSRQELGAELDKIIIGADKEKSNTRFYQSAKARGYIDVTDAGFVIRLLKTADPSTIVHELGHYFTIRYISALNKVGRIDEATDVLDWLGVKDVSGLQTEHYEKFARGFETYVMEGVAPSAGLKRLFTRFKNFLLGVYRDLVTGKVVKPEEINDDVRAFFDKMFAIDEDAAPVDLDAMKGKTDALRKVVSSAMKGEQISVEGMGINEIEGLLNLMNARIPRKPKNLEQMLRSVGGIDMDFAKQFDLLQLMGVQDKKGGAGGLFKKDGVINREDALVGFLKENGFIRGEETDAASSADLWYQALAALENAKELYTPEGMAQMDRRNNIIGAAEEAAKILSGHDYDAVVKAVKTLKRADVAAVSKDTLKYIRAKTANIQKDYEKLVKSMIKAAKKDFVNIQKDLQAFIKTQPISAESKVKLLSRAKNATDLAKYYKIAETIKSKALEYYDLEARKFLREQIDKAVKQSRPSSVEKQRYDYENNSLFADLRKYAQMTQSEAKAAADGMRRGMNEDDVSELRETDKIRLRFLEAKAQGAGASKELLAAVLEDIQNAKTAGRAAKDAADHENAVNREQERQEILEKLKYSEADEDRLKTKFMNVYRRGFTNLYSMLNSMFGRDIADKYQFEVLQTKTDTAIFEKIESSMKSAAGIFGVKDRDLPALFVKMTENKRDLYDKDLNRFKLNTFDVMDIYNAIKNEKTREDYYRSFGKENVALLVSSLSREEKLFADYLMREVNAYYDKMNAVYIKMYAIDLPKVENYWPATSLHKDQIDILGDFQGQSDMPSSLKERSKHAVTPRPQNAVEKFNRHIAEAEYVTALGLTYMEAKRIFKSERIKNGIINHFGAGVYKDLMGNLESLSLKNRFERIDAVTGRLNKLLNNVVLAKIALAPSVFVKQLISVTNYAEQVGYVEWAKGFAEALSHPEKTVREMKEALPFLKARLAGGNNEALIIALAGKRTVWKDMLSAMTRYGDLAAVVYGGYPYFKKLKESGAPDIEEKFMFATLRSMQSGTAVSLSPFQRNAKGWRIFTMFKNTPQQYMRKLVDALVMKKNGDISKEEFRRVMVNYGIVQPTLLALVSLGWAELWKEFVFNTDDEDEEKEGEIAAAVLREVLLNPFAGVPIVSSLVEAGVNKATGDRVYGMSSLLLDDVNDALLTFNKQDKDAFDYSTMIAPVVEALTAAPASRVSRFVKKLTKRSEEE